MSLESADKLVQRILRQMRVPHRVEDRPEGKRPAIVADVDSLSDLPAELHPYVEPKKADSAPDD